MHSGLGVEPAACFRRKGKGKHIWAWCFSHSQTPARNKSADVIGIILVQSYYAVNPLVGNWKVGGPDYPPVPTENGSVRTEGGLAAPFLSKESYLDGAGALSPAVGHSSEVGSQEEYPGLI